MLLVIYFLAASIISFIGSIQPGPVNMAVVLAAGNKQYKRAINIAIGGAIPESIFAGVALYASLIIISYQAQISLLFQLLAYVFIVLGLCLFFVKSKQKVLQQNGSKNALYLGLLLSALNPQLIVFWTAVITWFEANQLGLTSANLPTQISFLIGTSVGAFALHLLLILLCKKYEQSLVLTTLNKYSNKIIGTILIGLGLIKLLVG